MEGMKFELMPEIQVLLKNLSKAEDYGYKHFWTNERDFAYSFRIGGVCKKYHKLLDWIDGQLKIHCSESEFDFMSGQIDVIRKSTIMRKIEGIDANPMSFRIDTVNVSIRYLLDKFQNDMHRRSGIQICLDVESGERQVTGNTNSSPSENQKVLKPKLNLEISELLAQNIRNLSLNNSYVPSGRASNEKDENPKNTSINKYINDIQIEEYGEDNYNESEEEQLQ